jgi:hypothetical protein
VLVKGAMTGYLSSFVTAPFAVCDRTISVKHDPSGAMFCFLPDYPEFLSEGYQQNGGKEPDRKEQEDRLEAAGAVENK